MRACELVEMRESHGECVRLESPDIYTVYILYIYIYIYIYSHIHDTINLLIFGYIYFAYMFTYICDIILHIC